jgi:16S rRNA (cytosine967-C5)-methyltransferase
MHPKTLLAACSDLVALVLRFDHPADAAVVSRFFREHKALGPRERATTERNGLQRAAQEAAVRPSGPVRQRAKERRLAILGFHGPRDFLVRPP